MSDIQLPSVTEQEINDGKMMAYVSYASMFTGLPLFAIPMIQKDNAFSLQHAKYAGATWILLFVSAVVITIINICAMGFLSFLYLLPWLGAVILGIMGFLNANKGKLDPPPAVGGLAQKMFGSMQAQPKG